MGDTARVLLVDDESAVAELTATYLERVSESLTTAVETVPTNALERLDAERFECVVSDYDMPQMDGLALLDNVREVDSDLPFVLFTGKGSEEIASEALSAGVTDYLQKGTGTEQYEVLANRIENAVAQNRAKQEAEEANEQMRRMLERVTDAFFALDDDWRFRYVNERAAHFLDRDRDELVGRDLREVFPDAESAAFYDAYKEAFETQEPTSAEAESTVRSDLHIKSRAFPSEDGLSVYGRDVTEHREMETELRDTKAKREALYDVANRVVSCASPEEIYEVAVEVAEDILEFDFCAVDAAQNGELVQQAVSDPVTTDGYYESMPLDADNLGAEVYRTGETKLVHDLDADGYTPAESDYQSALTVPLGEFGVFQAVSEQASAFDSEDRELTELLTAHLTEALRRIETESALRAERDRFVALFENVPNAVLSCVYEEGEPVIRSVNPAFEEIFGWDAETVLEEPIDKYVVPSDAQEEAKSFNEQAAQGTHIEGAEVRRVTTDGLRDFLLNTASVNEGDETEDVSVYTEITEQKERERKLSRQNERLDEFASVVSHDLRNPLNVAQGRFDLLKDDCGSDHLVHLSTALDRIDALVADLLALARQNEAAFETEEVEITTLAEQAWVTAETADADLEIGDGVSVEADPGRIRQLFENLFRNAVEHGGESVTVEVDSLGQDGFYVADDGPGIPEDKRDQVFEYGFTTDRQGTGFGLSIVADAAEVHDWSVEVGESEDGGARFDFRV